MRIAILGTCYVPPRVRGGEERVIHELKKRFESAGHRVDVFTPSFRKWRDLERASTAAGTQRLPVPGIPFFYHFFFALRLRSALGGRRYDAVLNTHAALGYRLGRHPHVVCQPEPVAYGAGHLAGARPRDLLEKAVRVTVARRVEGQVMRSCDRVVGVNQQIGDYLRRTHGLPHEKVSVVGNGIDCERFAPPARRPASHGRPVLVFAGRLAAVKNLELLVRALGVLRDRGVDAELRVAGDGPLRGSLEALAARQGLGPRVRFLGWVDAEALPALYGAGDLFVMCSHYEGFPNALLEAQACGLPAVVTPMKGGEKLVLDGVTGAVAAEATPACLAGAIERLLEDRVLRRRMGRRARERMVREHGWERVAGEYLRMFRECGSDGRGRVT